MNSVSELDFCQTVEDTINQHDGYIEAVIAACDLYNLEVSVGAKLISQPIIEKIQSEGENTNLLPNNPKLPM